MPYVVVANVSNPFLEHRREALNSLPYEGKVELFHRDSDTTEVRVFCPMWVRKPVILPTSYVTKDFTPQQILDDVADEVLAMFGLKLCKIQ